MENMPIFDLDTAYSQVFWVLIIFVFLYALISKLIAPRAREIMQNRKDYENANIIKAERLSNEAKLLNEQYSKQLHDINIEAENVHKQVVITLEQTFKKKNNDLNLRFANQQEDLLKEIKQFQLDLDKKAICTNISAKLIEQISGVKSDELLLEQCYNKVYKDDQ
ncbi:MAG: hypothetical protein AB8B67_02920 [Rickettsiaceae bacterium]